MTNSKSLVRSTLSSTAHLSINKKAIQILGLNGAAFLSDLISRDEYWDIKGKPDNSEFFFCEQKIIKAEIGINEHEQRKAVKKLIDLGIIETERKGIPPRIWFKICYDTVMTNILIYEDINIDISIYNNKNKYNNTSKEVKRVSPSVNKKLLFLLEEWRLKEQIPKSQHHLKEDSKIQKKIAMLTNLLLNGKFGNHCTLSKEFLSYCNLTPEKINRKYSKDELLAGLDEMADMFKLNNLPEDKTKISKMGFDQLIYHPIAKISYLLKFLWLNNKELSYKTVQVYGHWLEKLYTEGIFNRDIEDDHHQFGMLKKGLAGIEEYYKWMSREPLYENQHRSSLIRNEDAFFNIYVAWLNEINVDLNAWFIGPQSDNWYRFIKWLEEAIHGDFTKQYPTLDKRKYK